MFIIIIHAKFFEIVFSVIIIKIEQHLAQIKQYIFYHSYYLNKSWGKYLNLITFALPNENIIWITDKRKDF
jgi:hypothetical protein